MSSRIAGASTSSMGAVTYRQLSSIRSTAGGVGMPGGEGMVISPSSPEIFATTPANGARRYVRDRSACTAVTRALACSTSAWVARHATARVCASESA